MPLRYPVETLLLLFLAILSIAAGVFVRVAIALPGALLLLGLGAATAVLYAFALYPVWRAHRVEYVFRLLHFLPAVILTLGALLAAGDFLRLDTAPIRTPFLWGFALLPVSLSFLCIVIYCGEVMRHHVVRVWTIVPLFIVFAAASVAAERTGWTQRFTQVAREELQAQIINILPSRDRSEERWRMSLRRMERRSERVADSSSEASVERLKQIAQNTQSTIAAGTGITVPPPRLPKSGFGFEAMAVFFLASYCAVLHRRVAMRT